MSLDTILSAEPFILTLRLSVEPEKFADTFKRDVTNRVSEVSKYVHPDLGTARIAFAFIPSGPFMPILPSAHKT